MLSQLPACSLNLSIGISNRIFPKFPNYPSKDLLDKKSGVTACQSGLVNVCKGFDLLHFKLQLIRKVCISLN
jgi:hypothetical protein